MKNKLVQLLISDESISWQARRIIALILLLFADVLFCIPFRGWGNAFGFIPWYRTVNLAPDFITGVFAVIFVVPLYMRKVLRGNFSLMGIITAVLTIFLAASYIKILFTGGVDGPLRLSSTTGYFVFVASLVFSWAGLRLFAGLGFCALFFIASVNILNVNSVLGFWGFVIVIATFLGIVLQSDFSLFGDFFAEFIATYRRPVAWVRNRTKDIACGN